MKGGKEARTNPAVRTRDGRVYCDNCDAWAPYKPSKRGGRSCPNCDHDL